MTACSPAPDPTTQSNDSANESKNGKQSAYADNPNEVRITFVPLFQGQEIQCGQLLNIHNKQWYINELAMFFSQFSLNISGDLILDDNDWQSQQVALIRLARDCDQATSNTTVTAKTNGVRVNYEHDSILAAIENPKTTTPITLSFNVGVPFAVNHQNPLIQASPLNDSSMFWVWRNGYKFIRWDMQSESGDSWSFHLGSVGCESAAMVRAPKEPCAQPNLIPVVVTLASNSIQLVETENPNSQTSRVLIKVSIHLDAILDNIETTRKNSCMFSGIDSTTCSQLLENLKLNAIFK